MYETWDEYFIDMARFVSNKSKDPSTSVGSVIVGPDHEIRSTGYNGFCRGVRGDIPTRWERPEKYQRAECAERNAIYNAARIGVSTKGCTVYILGPPCVNCARAIIQSGITEVVFPVDNPFSNREDWQENLFFAARMLDEAGVRVRRIDV